MDLDALIDRFRGPLVGLLASWGNDRGAATDLAQDVFAEAWFARAGFRGDFDDERAIGPWLRGIARNLHRQARRRAQGSRVLRRVGSLDDVPPERLATAVDTGPTEAALAVRAAVERLRQPLRTVLTMRYVEGSDLAAIAAVLGTSVRAVEGRLRRARQELKSVLPAPRSEPREPLAQEDRR